jgi:hypothetical protein
VSKKNTETFPTSIFFFNLKFNGMHSTMEWIVKSHYLKHAYFFLLSLILSFRRNNWRNVVISTVLNVKNMLPPYSYNGSGWCWWGSLLPCLVHRLWLLWFSGSSRKWWKQ